jgi:hypothetical protein
MKNIKSIEEFLSNLLYSKFDKINEKIIGGEASEWLFNYIYEKYLKEICYKLDNGEKIKNGFSIEVELDGAKIKEFLKGINYNNFKISSYRDNLYYEKLTEVEKVEFVKKYLDDKILELNIYVWLGDEKSSSIRIEGVKNYEDYDQPNLYKSWGYMDINEDDLIHGSKHFLSVFRHELQHTIQDLVYSFTNDQYIQNILKRSAVKISDGWVNLGHHNKHTEYDARFIEFAYNVRDENWDYLFISSNKQTGFFSYNPLYICYFSEYLKGYNKQQIFTKLYQLGCSNQNIINFKIEFKKRLTEYLNGLNELSIPSLEYSILIDLFVKDEPLHKFCLNFNINPYDFMTDDLKNLFLNYCEYLNDLPDGQFRQSFPKYTKGNFQLKIKRDSYWRNLI